MSFRSSRLASKTAALAFVTALSLASGATAAIRGDFDQADADHDGRVTFVEFKAYVTQRADAVLGSLAARFKALSPEEQTARLKARFDKADADHKGYLTRDDWAKN